jgi:hypothetical protein
LRCAHSVPACCMRETTGAASRHVLRTPARASQLRGYAHSEYPCSTVVASMLAHTDKHARTHARTHRPCMHACTHTHATKRAQVRLSVVEIYCERIRDLLEPASDNLAVKQDPSGAIFIEGARAGGGGGRAGRRVQHAAQAAREP